MLVPGDMGRYSFVLLGTKEAERRTFGSACHGAGRTLSRNKARERARGRDIGRELANGFIFVNLVDFDMLYGHRRDAAGYRRALEEFDRDLVRLERELRAGDLVMLTADHGNDPTHVQTTDHTRE